MIHGQISVGWVPHLSIDAIVVADSDLVGDSWAQKVMMMGLPPEVRLTGFVAPENLASLLAGVEYQNHRVLVIFRNIESVQDAVSSGFQPETLNLGNQACQCPEADIRLADTFYARPDDLKKLELLRRSGLAVLLQALPAGKAVQWKPEND